jgi:hypothetical protein
MSDSTIRIFRGGLARASVNHLAAIRAAVEAAGVEFTNGDRA